MSEDSKMEDEEMKTDAVTVEVPVTAAPKDERKLEKIEVIAPNQTLYLQHLNEKISKPKLKKALYELCGQFGPVLDIIAAKTMRMRGQAWVVFTDIETASKAYKKLQGFEFLDKKIQVSYAKTKSDAVAKLDGTYVRREKRQAQPAKKQEPVAKKQATAARKAAPESDAKEAPVLEEVPPNKRLFIQNLPDECTKMMIEMLFRQFPGFEEARMVPGKAGIAFVDFEDELKSGVAMSALQGFKITEDAKMTVNFAK